jgi:hypothetical protein
MMGALQLQVDQEGVELLPKDQVVAGLDHPLLRVMLVAMDLV